VVQASVEGSMNVLNAIRASKQCKRLVHTSSIAAVHSTARPAGYTFSVHSRTALSMDPITLITLLPTAIDRIDLLMYNSLLTVLAVFSGEGLQHHFHPDERRELQLRQGTGRTAGGEHLQGHGHRVRGDEPCLCAGRVPHQGSHQGWTSRARACTHTHMHAHAYTRTSTRMYVDTRTHVTTPGEPSVDPPTAVQQAASEHLQRFRRRHGPSLHLSFPSLFPLTPLPVSHTLVTAGCRAGARGWSDIP
jgi:hypothetical protein